MKVVSKTEGTPYPAHGNSGSMRKLSANQDSKRISVMISHLLPESVLEWGSAPAERVYYVLTGSLSVKTKTDQAILQAGDLVYFPGGEEREGRVMGTEVCTILVCGANL
jgi:ethanolamine utilization protein EutQ (cupin superfamily)